MDTNEAHCISISTSVHSISISLEESKDSLLSRAIYLSYRNAESCILTQFSALILYSTHAAMYTVHEPTASFSALVNYL